MSFLRSVRPTEKTFSITQTSPSPANSCDSQDLDLMYDIIRDRHHSSQPRKSITTLRVIQEESEFQYDENKQCATMEEISVTLHIFLCL